MPSSEVTQLHVELLGVVVPLDVSGTDLSAAVADVWRDSVRESSSGPAGQVAQPVTVAVGERSRADVTGADIHEALHALSSVVVGTAIARSSGELLMLSGVAVAALDSHTAAVLVGPRGPHLTEVATTLGRDFLYLADQTVGITSKGRVEPALSPLPKGEPGKAPTLVPPSSQVRVPATRASYPVVAVLVLEHDPQHRGETFVEPIDTIDALAALAEDASGLGRLDRPLQRMADILQRAGGARRVTYSAVDTLAPVVRDLLDGAAG